MMFLKESAGMVLLSQVLALHIELCDFCIQILDLRLMAFNSGPAKRGTAFNFFKICDLVGGFNPVEKY